MDWIVFGILAVVYIVAGAYYVSVFTAYTQSSSANMISYPDWITYIPLFIAWLLWIICLPGALVTAVIGAIADAIQSRWRSVVSRGGR